MQVLWEEEERISSQNFILAPVDETALGQLRWINQLCSDYSPRPTAKTGANP